MDDSSNAHDAANSEDAGSPGSTERGNGHVPTSRGLSNSSRSRVSPLAVPSSPMADRATDQASVTSVHSVPLQQMMAASLHANRVEQVDVAIVGAGLCGLACAAAVHRVRPDCVVKVYERRPNPHEAAAAAASSDNPDTTEFEDMPVGGGVRLEANGLKALTAISRKLAAGALAEGLYAQHVLLHDTETGTVITHLQEQPHLSSSSPRQPALVVGWSELEQLLLEQLPEGTVEWGAISTSYTDMASQGGVLLEVLIPKPAADARQHLTASPAEAESRVVSPFQAVAAVTTGSNWGAAGGNNISRPATPAPAAAAAAAASGQLQGSNKGVELERVLVKARLVIAADGPMSLVRQQLAGDGPPHFDGTVRWVGRLPGDLLSTIPVAHEAWWLGPGVTFNSHPLRCGDVVWEAQVSSSTLAAAGLRWDEASHSLTPIKPSQDSSGSGPDSQAAAGVGNGGSDGAGNNNLSSREQQQQLQGTGNQMMLRRLLLLPRMQADKRAAAAAAAPAGEWEAGDSEEVVAAAQDAAADVAAGAGSAPMGAVSADPAERLPTQALLEKLFATFPAPVLDMISATPPSCVLEAAVHTRPARLLPASLGRGGVAVLGQAACPLRPTGQECSQALEDAAELGAAVMAAGISREALRRLELKRRPRWKHAMQVSQALGSVSNLGGASLHQGLLDYTGQLHNISFVPLRTIPQTRRSRTKQLMKLAAYGLLASGIIAGVSGAAERHSKGKNYSNKPRGPVGQVLAGVAEVPKAASDVLSNVTSVAAKVPGHLAKAVRVGGKAEHGLQHGLGSAVHAIGDAVDEAAAGETSDGFGGKVVYGNVPGSKGNVPSGGPGRFRDAVLGRVMRVGGVLSKPFVRLARHRVAHTVAKDLGAF